MNDNTIPMYDFQPFETQYHQSLLKVLNQGIVKTDRTGTGTISIPHQYFYLKDVDKNFPIIKAKAVFPKMALKELVWMMMGRTDVAWLQQHGVTYWNEWADEKGELGKTYGYQFRNFNGVDQLNEMIRKMVYDTDSRRNIINLWNVGDLEEMNLPPCVMNYQVQCIPTGEENQYYVDMNVLQRSADSFLGIPYDFMFVGWFLQILCELAENQSMMDRNDKYFIARDVHYTCNDYHIYLNHIDQVKEYSRNFIENKNNVINGLAIPQIDCSFGDNSVDDYLVRIETSNFANFKINKEYKDEYGKIAAQIAI